MEDLRAHVFGKDHCGFEDDLTFAWIFYTHSTGEYFRLTVGEEHYDESLTC
jgi:hypothetical protein